jgi:hypothetical protein
VGKAEGREWEGDKASYLVALEGKQEPHSLYTTGYLATINHFHYCGLDFLDFVVNLVNAFCTNQKLMR